MLDFFKHREVLSRMVIVIKTTWRSTAYRSSVRPKWRCEDPVSKANSPLSATPRPTAQTIWRIAQKACMIIERREEWTGRGKTRVISITIP